MSDESDGCDTERKRKVGLPADDVELGDDICLPLSGERWRVGDVLVDHESRYDYFALLDTQTGEFGQLVRFPPDKKVTVYTPRELKTEDD